jgi:hypothetical protein
MVGFKGHPLVVKQVSLFMATQRVDPSEILGMTNNISKATSAANEAAAESKRLTEASALQRCKLDALLKIMRLSRMRSIQGFSDLRWMEPCKPSCSCIGVVLATDSWFGCETSLLIGASPSHAELVLSVRRGP